MVGVFFTTLAWQQAPKIGSSHRVGIVSAMSLAGRVTIVTGVSPGGIGIEIAQQLAAQGATVVIASRDERKANDALAILRRNPAVASAGGQCEWIPVNLADLRDVQR